MDASKTAMLATITDEHVRRYDDDGFFVLEGAVAGEALEMLRREADLAIAAEEERIRNNARDVEHLTHLGHRYFVIQRSRTRLDLRAFLWSALMTDVCARLVGPDAYLFTELFVCKRPGPETSFGWHQDHGYVDYFGFGDGPPNVTVWTALDDMTEENGTLRVLPFSRGGTRVTAKHHRLAGDRDIVADFGGGPGELLEMPAGSVVVMSGLLPHASGPNTTPGTRRAHLTQYSKQPVLIDGKTPAQLAVPVLQGGAIQAPDYSGQPPRGE
jgi:ectoine hydroxylase-related dioxygenase (phytanoyl-CoA dioxygenase family)